MLKMVLSLMSKVDMTMTFMDFINIIGRGRMSVVNDKRRTMIVSANHVTKQP
jgi:hypothetical protein